MYSKISLKQPDELYEALLLIKDAVLRFLLLSSGLGGSFVGIVSVDKTKVSKVSAHARSLWDFAKLASLRGSLTRATGLLTVCRRHKGSGLVFIYSDYSLII